MSFTKDCCKGNRNSKCISILSTHSDDFVVLSCYHGCVRQRRGGGLMALPGPGYIKENGDQNKELAHDYISEYD